MKCPRCGAENPEDRATCAACYAPLGAQEATEKKERAARPRAGGRRRGWVIGLAALVALAAIGVGVYAYLYGPLPAETIFRRLGERAEAAKKIYMRYTLKLEDGAQVRSALAIEKPERAWTWNEGGTGAAEAMCDGTNTFGHLEALDLWWVRPSATLTDSVVQPTLANLGAPSAMRATGIKKAVVRKGPTVKIKGERAYTLEVDMGGQKGTLYLSARSLTPLRARVKSGKTAFEIDYEAFAFDQAFPPEVRFKPPEGVTLHNEQALLRDLGVSQAAK